MSDGVEVSLGKLSGARAKAVAAALQALMEDRQGGDDDRQRPAMADQVQKLRDLRQRFERRHDLRPGQFVRIKDGMGTLRDDVRPTMALMLWRELDIDDPRDRMLLEEWTRKSGLGNDIADCLVAHICDDGHCLILLPMTLQELEPWEPGAAA